MRISRLIVIGCALAAIALTSGSLHAQQFSPYVDYGTDRGPIFAAVADVNGDGKLDILTSIYIFDKVDVLLGNGDGTFQTSVSYASGGDGPWIAVGDLNGDGKPDLVTANYTSNNTVSVLLGNGDGTFRAHVDYSTGVSPYSVVIGDFNGDGKPDLITANFGGSISVLLGNGDGTFQTHVDYNLGIAAQPVAVADLNGDGKLDIIVGSPGNNQISVLLGNGDGTFQPAKDYTAGAPYLIAVADVNRDGKLDLIGANACCNNVSVLLGNGDGAFQSPMYYATGDSPYGVAVGDFNADGKLDLVTVNYTGDSVSLLLGNGDGTFQSPVDYSTDLGPADSVSVGDFNMDGMLDLVVPDFEQGSGIAVSVLLNAGSGGGVPAATVSATSLSFGELSLSTSSSYRSVILSNIGTGTLNVSRIGLAGTNPTDFELLNGCGTTLPAGATCTVEINFKAVFRGNKSAALTISDNAKNSPQTVALSGTATANFLSASSMNFGNVNLGSSSTQTLTLKNVGSIATKIGSVNITWPDRNDFSQANTCGNSLAARASCSFSITFTPTAKRQRTANLQFSSNGTGSNAVTSVPLTGVGN